ncbi:hypothetical protein BDE02_11G059400 [Populus trichocarpa]|nr:hypothetical protein BDE02_11G059400 [Populus trichocarpa]
MRRTLIPPNTHVKDGKKSSPFSTWVLVLSAIVAGFATTNYGSYTFPFFTWFFQFQSQFNDLPTFMFFVVDNAIASE